MNTSRLALPFSLLTLGLGAPLLAAAAQSLDGFWQSQGYGNVYQISGPSLRAFEVTAKTCVPGFSARRLPGSLPGREATFKAHGGDVFFLGPGPDDDHKLLIHPGGLVKLRLHRLPQMPSICATPTENTPSANFEVLAQTFREHYIAFGLRHIDWDAIVAANRPKVTPQTKPNQLFDLLNSMLKQLDDLHVGIGAPRLHRESPGFFRAGTDRVIQNGIDYFAGKGRRALFAPMDHQYLHGPLRNLCNGKLQYGRIHGTIGYLRILSFSGYAKFGKDRLALEHVLDQIFSEPGLQALIIDVRLSFGGDDQLGLTMAARLTNKDYLAYSIQARADPVDPRKWGDADPVLVRPVSRPGFLGPVIELIGPITMSAAETFTQALMGRTPHVIRIGENTQGVFCDPLERRLPSAWNFDLPNAVYRTEDGTAFDVDGIPPDIRVPLFTDADVAARKDPAMAAALQLVGSTK